MHVLRANRRVLFADDAIVRTEAPETIRSLFHQRLHWCHGSLDSAIIHRGGLVRGSWHGRVVGMPNFLYLNALAPLLAIPAIPFFFWTNPRPVPILIVMSVDCLAAWLAYAMDRERMRELVVYPLWRLVYAVFIAGTLAILLYRLATGRRAWIRSNRTGSVLPVER